MPHGSEAFVFTEEEDGSWALSSRVLGAPQPGFVKACAVAIATSAGGVVDTHFPKLLLTRPPSPLPTPSLTGNEEGHYRAVLRCEVPHRERRRYYCNNCGVRWS